MNKKLTIVKVSGKIIEDPAQLKSFVKSFAAIKGAKLLIHSGAMMASQVAEKLGMPTKTINDRPIVDEKTLQLLVMVYGGLVNNRLVGLLQGRKVNAAGLTGADMNLITSVRQQIPDMGATGEVRQVNATMLGTLLDAGVVPVLAPLTHDGRGNLLFNETDALASEISKSLALRYDITLVYCFERRGVLLNVQDPDSVVPVLSRNRYKAFRDMGIIKDWFANKVDNAFSAIDHGVKEVIITNAVGIADLSQGTHIK